MKKSIEFIPKFRVIIIPIIQTRILQCKKKYLLESILKV